MSDPQRYLDDERAAPLAQRLLRSAEGDGLDDARAEAIARSLETRAATASSLAEPTLVKASGLKWGLLAISVVAAIAATVDVFVARSDEVKPHEVSPIVMAAPTSEGSVTQAQASAALETHESPVAHRAPAAAASASAVPVAMLPAAHPSARVARPTSAAPSRAPLEQTTDLAGEVRALEAVRSAISERRVVDARAGLASYQTGFSTKLLAKEARVLEIEMLLAEGRRAEAEALAAAFLATSESSPYATRVRSLIANPRLP